MANTTWCYWLHLPGCVLDGSKTRPWAQGELQALDHDTWCALDQTVWQPNDYRDCSPVFFHCEVNGGRDPFGRPDAETFGHIAAMRQRLHRALATVASWPLPPDPAQSCGYVMAKDADRCEIFLVGSSGRDWILCGHFRQPRQYLDNDTLDQAEITLEHLRMLHDSLPGTRLQAALEMLAMLSLPDAYVCDLGSARWELVFLNAVASLEYLLLGTDDVARTQGQSITTAFGQHLGTLLAGNAAEAAELASVARAAYRMRSDLMHGRRGLVPDDLAYRQTMAFGIRAFQAALRSAVLLATHAGADMDLPALLAHATSDPAQFAALKEHLRGTS